MAWEQPRKRHQTIIRGGPGRGERRAIAKGNVREEKRGLLFHIFKQSHGVDPDLARQMGEMEQNMKREEIKTKGLRGLLASMRGR